MVKRTMKDKIRLALTAKGSLTQRELFEYICDELDADATIITVYLTLRIMINDGIVIKTGDEYAYQKSECGLI